MVIVGLVNNDFEPWKIYALTAGTEWGSRAERDPLAMGGRNVTQLSRYFSMSSMILLVLSVHIFGPGSE